MELKRPPCVVEEVSDVNEVTKARRQRELFDRNAAWLQRHLAEIYAAHVEGADLSQGEGALPVGKG